MSLTSPPNQNHLLAALPVTDLARLTPHLQLMPIPLGEILYGPGGQLRHAYFPTTSIMFLHYVTESGASPEIASDGNEGVVRVSLFIRGKTTPSSTVLK